jgi:uncharacterized protein with PIN domain
MVVDSSVFIAILILKPDAEHFLNQLMDAQGLCPSTVSLIETAIIIEYKKDKQGQTNLLPILASVSLPPVERSRCPQSSPTLNRPEGLHSTNTLISSDFSTN